MTDETDKVAEVWIADGEAWFPDAPALCARLGADYLTHSDGELYAGLKGKGEVALADLLAAEGAKSRASAVVTPIK